MKIRIKNLQKKIRINPHQITKIARATLHSEKVNLSCELSLLFVNDKFIKSLNRKYFKRNSATDVIAFPLERGLENKNALLGDVVISTETVARNARFYGNTPQQELAFCLIHGILHLLGYNDYNKRAKKDMFKRQEKILNLITD